MNERINTGEQLPERAKKTAHLTGKNKQVCRFNEISAPL